MTGQENQCRRILCPCKKQLFHLTKSAVVQIAKTVQWFETIWNKALRKVLMQLKTGLVVLGLATSHDSQMFQNECRYVQVISLDILRTP